LLRLSFGETYYPVAAPSGNINVTTASIAELDKTWNWRIAIVEETVVKSSRVASPVQFNMRSPRLAGRQSAQPDSSLSDRTRPSRPSGLTSMLTLRWYLAAVESTRCGRSFGLYRYGEHEAGDVGLGRQIPEDDVG